MTVRVATLSILVVVLLGGLLPAVAVADTALPLPATMAGVGDSITQAASSAGSLGVDAPQNSWSTGTNTSVNSHYLRLLALGAPISGQNNNLSVSGAKAAGLNAQMQNVVAVHPDYLTVEIGGNDLCTSTTAAMTSVSDFHDQFLTAITTEVTGSPNTNVYVVSIPDAYQLWSLFHNNGWARFIWSIGGVCQSLLANPTSTLPADVQRRALVRQRNIDYNTQLAAVCATFASRCHYDGNAIFNTQFATSDVSGDYFHPSVAGQAKLASVSWSVGYIWATSSPPNTPPTASFTSSCSGLTCALTDTSTDSDGTIAGRAWSFGDSATSTASNPSHTYAAGGTYTVQLTVTDNDGATASASSTVTVTAPPPPEPMWVGGLAATTTTARNTWTATVTIHVVDQFGPVGGVSVAGTWSAGSGGISCITNSAGDCLVTSSSLNKKTTTVTYAVTGLTKVGWTYNVANNVMTSISVPKP
jgi:PKD repeat protein